MPNPKPPNPGKTDPGNVDPNQIREIIDSVLRVEAESILGLADNLPSSCVEAVELLFQCRGRVIVTGMGKMSAIARKTAATLCSIGTPAVFLHPSEAQHGDLGIVSSSDVLLALSNSGETRDILELVPFMKRHHVPVVSVTGSAGNSLAELSDCHLATGVSQEADTITAAPTTSTTTTLALCDGLAMTLVKMRGFTAEQFAIYHPSGKLGRTLLLRVGDLMATASEIPFVDQTATLREAIVSISRGKIGAGFIVDANRKLLGIVTDGDLRRVLERDQNPLDQIVTDLMTHNPKTLEADLLAVEALNRMNENSISAMPVVGQAGEVCGALHLHDLLKAGLS